MSWLIINHLGVKPARGGRPDSERIEAIRSKVAIGFFEKEVVSDFMVVTDSLFSASNAAETVMEYT